MSWFDDLKTPRVKGAPETTPSSRSSKVPEGLWVKCPSCSEILQNRTLQTESHVCPTCDHHFRISANERIQLLTDAGSFKELHPVLRSKDPLHFDDVKPYKQRLKSSHESTGAEDALLAGQATLEGLPFFIGAFEFKFMGGSMGVVVGEKVALVFENALKKKLPAVIVSASGGARMQEGILSLMQMAKTSALISEMRRQGLPYISILSDPTTGGVAASFAMLGDIHLAEPKALIGFAGPRVIEQTIRQELPEGFQRSEFLLEHGFIDRIVHRKKLRKELHYWLRNLGSRTCDFKKNETKAE